MEFHRDENDRFILTVRDNGIGFPDGLDFSQYIRPNLVNTLFKQVNATIKLHENGKTEFIIKFSELKHNKRI